MQMPIINFLIQFNYVSIKIYCEEGGRTSVRSKNERDVNGEEQRWQMREVLLEENHLYFNKNR